MSKQIDVNMSKCLEEAGWPTTIASDGGIEIEIPTDQEDAYMAAFDECIHEFGYDLPPEPMDRERATNYVDVLESAARCLIDHGYSVPDEPERNELIDSLMSVDGPPLWDVYGDVSDSGELSHALDQCPVEE